MGVDRWVAAAFVVMASFDGGGAEDLADAAAVGILVDPFPDGVEHVTVELEAFVAGGGVVEDAEDIVYNFIHWDAWVFPGVDNTAKINLDGAFLGLKTVTYGAAYCKIVAATLPATALR